MLKENRGITLVALAVTVIVITIIVAITVTTGNELIKNSEKNKLKSNLYLIQSKAENMLEDYTFNFDEPLSEEISDEEKEAYLGGTIVDNYTTVRNVRF